MVAGRKPKENRDEVRHKMKPTHEWIEVPNVRYSGPRPQLAITTPLATRVWWDAVSTMPHCVLWTEEDWAAAMDAARAHTMWILTREVKYHVEVRICEARMGVGLPNRRDLRIRYVDVEALPDEEGITQLDEYRKMIAGVGE